MLYDNLLLLVLSCYNHLKPFLKFRTPSVYFGTPLFIKLYILSNPFLFLKTSLFIWDLTVRTKVYRTTLTYAKICKIRKVSPLEMCSKYSLHFLLHVWSFFNLAPFIRFLEFFSIQTTTHSTPIPVNKICIFAKCFPNSRVSQ